MPEIFINYRVRDEPYAAALLDRELSARFGPARVFRASRSIRPGRDFVDELVRGVRAASVVLAVVGPQWRARRPRPIRAGSAAVGWAERELAEAFHRRIPVIPILVAGATLPAETELPLRTRALARCQYLRLHHGSLAADVACLVDELVVLVPTLLVPPGFPNGATPHNGPTARLETP